MEIAPLAPLLPFARGQRHAYEEGPPHYAAKAEIERTSLLQVG